MVKSGICRIRLARSQLEPAVITIVTIVLVPIFFYGGYADNTIRAADIGKKKVWVR